MLRPPSEVSVDGFSLAEFRTGHVYALPAELATLMIVEGWAEPVMDDAPPDLPRFRLEILSVPRRPMPRRFTHPLLDTRLGMAAERKKRRT